MKLKLRENADINTVTGISDIIIDSINKKWDNIRDFNSIIVNLNEEGYEDLVPVIESILEDENRNVGKLQQLVELVSPTASSIEDGKQEALDELDSDIEVEEMKLSENFPNVPGNPVDTDMDINVDATFVKAQEEHDTAQKEYEDALKENEKLAKETIPKEGDTGKKVTSKALKAMHLSEALFDEDLDMGSQMSLNSDLYHAIEDVGFKWRGRQLSKDDWEKAFEWVQFHFLDDDEYMDLEESLKAKKKDHLLEDNKNIKFDIAKEQIRKFKEGKMPKDWTPKDYIDDLVNRKHLSREEGEKLLSEDFDDDYSIESFRSYSKQALFKLKEAYNHITHGEEYEEAMNSLTEARNIIDKLMDEMGEQYLNGDYE